MVWNFTSEIYSTIQESLKDVKKRDKDLNIKINHIALKIILQCIYHSIYTRKQNIDDIIVPFKDLNKDIKMMCIDGNKKYYCSILASFILDYKEQVLITHIKVKLQYSTCQILHNKRVSNSFLEVTDLLVYLKSARIIIQ